MSGIKFEFEVEYADGRKVVARPKPKDFVAFERQYGLSIESMDKNARLEHMYYLAWSPLHRTGQEPRAFDEWLDAVEDIGDVEEEAPVAHPQGASAEPSPT